VTVVVGIAHQENAQLATAEQQRKCKILEHGVQNIIGINHVVNV
jgi:hypothetical protein